MSTNSIKSDVPTQKQNLASNNSSKKNKKLNTKFSSQREEQEKRDTTKKNNSVIDKIFATKNTEYPNHNNNNVKINSREAAIPSQLPKISKRKLKQNDEDGFSDTRGTKIRKRTEDGLPIYSVKELKLNDKRDSDGKISFYD